MKSLLSLNNIAYAWPQRAPVLTRASLSVYSGERLGLLGGNGAGKSTLLHIASGLIPPDNGSVSLGGRPCTTEEDFAGARKNLGYLLQHSADMLFCPTILEDVAFGPANQGMSAREAGAKALAMLEELGIAHLAAENGQWVSGGEKKMAALAAVLVMEPSLLFLDEPTNDLEPAARERLVRILEERGLPGLVVSHDREFLERLCTRFCRLEHGVVVEAEPGGASTV